MLFFSLPPLNLSHLERLTNQPIEVCSTRSWMDRQAGIGMYSWVDSNRVIHVSENQHVKPLKDGGYVEHGFMWQLYDLRTGKDTDITKPNGMAHDWDDITPSPDGSRLLWCGYRDSQAFWFMSRFDGSEVKLWPRHAVPGVISNDEPRSYDRWSLDGKQIIESQNMEEGEVTHMQVWVRDANHPETEQTLSPILNPGWSWLIAPAAGGAFVGHGGLSGSSQSETYIWRNLTSPKPQKVSVEIPKGYVDAWGGWVSSDGKSILWGLQKPYQENTSGGYSIAISQIGQSKMKVIYDIPATPILSGQKHKEFGGISWVPGGKEASFIYGFKLYKIPVKG